MKKTKRENSSTAMITDCLEALQRDIAFIGGKIMLLKAIKTEAHAGNDKKMAELHESLDRLTVAYRHLALVTLGDVNS